MNRADEFSPVPTRHDSERWSTLRRAVTWIAVNDLRVVVGLSILTSAAAVVLAISSGGELAFADEGDYHELATSLGQHGRYSLDGLNATAFRPPGLPAFLASIAFFTTNLVALRVVNAMLIGIVVLLAGLTTRRIAGSPLSAVGAALLTAASPVGVYTASKLYPQTLATVLLLLALLTAITAVQDSNKMQRSLVHAAFSGLALAGLILTVPNYGVTVIPVVMWIAWRLRRASLRLIGVLLVAMVLPIGAWTARNAIAFGEFVPVSSNGGLNLLLGNSSNTGPDTGVMVDISEQTRYIEQNGLGEVAADHYLRDQAIDWIVADPGRAANLYILKMLNGFAVSEDLATEDQQPSTVQNLIIATTYLPVLTAFFARIVAAPWLPLRKGEGLLIAAFWFNLIATAIAFTRIRFRVPLDPIMAIVVVTGLSALVAGKAPSPGAEQTADL